MGGRRCLRTRRTVLGLLLVATTALGVAAPARAAPERGRRARGGRGSTGAATRGLVLPPERGHGDAARRRRSSRARPAEPLADADDAPRARPPAAARRRASRGAVRDPRGLAAPAARRAHRARRRSRPTAAAPRPDAAPAGPLEVLRRMPEGDVPLAPHLSITFSQPMVGARLARGARARGGPRAALAAAARRVALGGHADARLRARGPLPDGDATSASRCRPARGARPAGRWPAPSRWSFSTPPPRLLARHPQGGPARRDALMFAAFDQRIDPAAVARARCACARAAPPCPCGSPPRTRSRPTRPSRASRRRRSPAAGSPSARARPAARRGGRR